MMIKNVMVRLDGTGADARPVTTDPEHLVECSRLGRNSTRLSSVFTRC
jgi:hypothetical protein